MVVILITVSVRYCPTLLFTSFVVRKDHRHNTSALMCRPDEVGQLEGLCVWGERGGGKEEKEGDLKEKMYGLLVCGQVG